MRAVTYLRSPYCPTLILMMITYLGVAQSYAQKAPQLPGTTAHTLSVTWQEFLVKTMQSGECPCDSKKTLFECIQKEMCPQATQLANFAISKIQLGLNEDQVTDAVIEKYVADFVPPTTFKLDNTPFKGETNAKIVIVEFADFECPHCSLMSNMLKELLKAYPKEIKVYFKQFPLPFHTYAPLASLATLAAHKQGAFWAMHDLVFANQSKLNPQIFDEFAQQIGLNLENFKKDMMSATLKEQVEADKLEATQAGIQGTPTLFFNGKQYHGEPTLEGLKKHVEQLQQQLKAQPAKAK